MALVDPVDLVDFFEPLIGVYTTSTKPNACAIHDFLRHDWHLFENLKPSQTCSLLQAIFSDSDVTNLKYLPLVAQDSDALSQWETFREELKHENRFFPANVMEKGLLEQLLGLLRVEGNKLDSIVYRARIIEEGSSYAIEEMGSPPKETTSHGRANPFGIPCLYTASDENTAVSEVRPYKGGSVCMASFSVDPTMTCVDLRDPQDTISPFDLSEEDIRLVHRYMGYLCRLGDELSKPVIPKEAHLEYLPSQYLCEFIKHCGFDGVIYKSAMATGINYAIFNDRKLKGIQVKTYQINSIDVNFSQLS
ncbi:MAG: RES family NAD+ phosphorylase [Syntrophales bacterium]